MTDSLVRIWSVIGSVASTVALFVTLFLEWERRKGQSASGSGTLSSHSDSRFIGKLRFVAFSTVAGAVSGCVSGVFAALLFWFILAPLDPRPFTTFGLGFYLWGDLSFFVPNWALVGLIFGLFFEGGSNQLVSGLRDGVASMTLGFALGASVGLLTNVATFFGSADVHQSTTLSIALGGALGGIAFGILTRGAIKVSANRIYGSPGPKAES